jgi:endoglucanase
MRIMVAAHMDEIGIIANHIEKNGLVRFSSIGTVLPRYLPGSRVSFLNGAHGVINNEKPEDPSKPQSIEKYFIDMGTDSNENCPVKIGDLAVFGGEFLDLGQRVVCKALDNRAACAIAIETIKQIQHTTNEVIFVFSVQEEAGYRGAQTAAYGIEADLGFSLDVTLVGNNARHDRQCALGKGPAIKVRDANYISDQKVVNWMVEGARKINAPYQLEVIDTGSTGARMMQINRMGMLSGGLSLPCRYVHSPSEMIDMTDCENLVKLLVELLCSPVQLIR